MRWLAWPVPAAERGPAAALSLNPEELTDASRPALYRPDGPRRSTGDGFRGGVPPPLRWQGPCELEHPRGRQRALEDPRRGDRLRCPERGRRQQESGQQTGVRRLCAEAGL